MDGGPDIYFREALEFTAVEWSTYEVAAAYVFLGLEVNFAVSSRWGA